MNDIEKSYWMEVMETCKEHPYNKLDILFDKEGGFAEIKIKDSKSKFFSYQNTWYDIKKLLINLL